MWSRLAALRGVLHPTLRQVISYGMVGAVGFVVDVGGFNALRFAGGEGPLHDYPLAAKVISGAAATVVAWVGNRYWTFRHTRRDAAHQEFLLFALVAMIGTFIAVGCLWFSHYVLDLRSPLADNIAANGVGLALGMAFRFWASRRHVFRQPDRGEPTGSHEDGGEGRGTEDADGSPAQSSELAGTAPDLSRRA
ncbi:MAG TPA: GtrA family protein [Dermatophilaceae bacterium]|nr:GtrA family protein [Dermatophilaceae bacterium]